MGKKVRKSKKSGGCSFLRRMITGKARKKGEGSGFNTAIPGWSWSGEFYLRCGIRKSASKKGEKIFKKMICKFHQVYYGRGVPTI